jgi:hypothetical protein
MDDQSSKCSTTSEQATAYTWRGAFRLNKPLQTNIIIERLWHAISTVD